MQNKLQELTDKLYNEGLSKGKQEGEQILAEARKQADELVAQARAKADSIIAQAHKEAAELKHKADSDLALASRETLSVTRQRIESLVVAKMSELAVKEALSESAFVKEIIAAVAKAFNTDEACELSLILSESQKAALEPFVKNELSQMLGAGVEVSFSKNISGGLKIGPKDGGYFISLDEAAFQELISSYLRPATRKILFGE
ncbi:MAG: hypothetical protein IJU13_08495 [Bacteroidales bacterium]|nr:hypothetical protein [Bacteroidales bacterium]